MTRRTRYALRRLALTVPVVVTMSVFVFLVIHLVPGDPVQAMLGLRSTPALEAQVRSDLHLDRSLPEQYVDWARGVVLHGDLGHDYASGESVTSELGTALPVTVELGVAVVLLGAITGIALGATAATGRRWRRRSTEAFVILGTAIPEFWMGIMLVLLFTTTLALLPPSGYVSLFSDPVSNARYFAMPVVCLAIFQAAYFARTARTAIEEALQAPSVLLLRAKGLPQRSILWRHALRNAAPPIVTIVGLQFGAILGGAIVIETLFGLPGVGKLLLDAITTRNYTVVQGCVLVIGGMFVLVNLFTDLVVGWLDPRIGDGTAR
jgi:peptide/nickel transport system permease protein